MSLLPCLLSLHLLLATGDQYVFSECKDCTYYRYIIDNKAFFLKLGIEHDDKNDYRFFVTRSMSNVLPDSPSSNGT